MRRAEWAGEGVEKCAAVRISRLDLYLGRAADRHAGCGGRGIVRSEHHGHGAVAIGNLGAIYFCKFQRAGGAACGVPRRDTAAIARIQVRRIDIGGASRLYNRLELEGVCRQLSGGLPHSDRAPWLDARDRLRAIPHGDVSLLLAAVRADPRDEERRLRRAVLCARNGAARGALFLGIPEFDGEHISQQCVDKLNPADLARKDPADLLLFFPPPGFLANAGADRKSTRLNSSHQIISYAVFCLKKKKKYPIYVIEPPAVELHRVGGRLDVVA